MRWKIALLGAVCVMGLVVASARGGEADRPSTQELLARLKTYRADQSRADLNKLIEAIRDAQNDPAAREAMESALLEVLQSDATLDCKQVICQQLWVFGGSKSAAVLVKMLGDEQLAEMARYALRTNPDPAVDESLREMVKSARGKTRIGMVNMLGERADAQGVAIWPEGKSDRREVMAARAVAVLAPLVTVEDAELAAAAAEALGKVGTSDAAKALIAAGRAADPRMANALLTCAGNMLIQSGLNGEAWDIYEKVYQDAKQTRSSRIAALIGMGAADPAKAELIVIGLIEQGDEQMLPAVARLIRTGGSRVAEAAAAAVQTAGASRLPALIEALAQRGDAVGVTALLEAISSSNPQVRLAAIQGLAGAQGAESALSTLAKLAGGNGGAERDAAVIALARMRGANVDQAMLGMLTTVDVPTRIGLIRALGQRRATSATAAMLKAAGEKDAGVRLAAIEALGDVAGPEKYDAILTVLLNAQADDQRTAAEKTVLAVARRAKTPADAVKPIADLLKEPGKKVMRDIRYPNGTSAWVEVEEGPNAASRMSLVRVLGRLGTPEALAAIRKELTDPSPDVIDQVVRALADWPDEAAADDLLKIAEELKGPVYRGLALRGYLRMARTAKIDSAAKLKMIERVRPLLASAQEKTMLLSALSEGGEAAFLSVAVSYVNDAQVQREAALAVLKISETAVLRQPQAVREAMAAIKQTVKDDELITRATAMELRTRNIAPTGKASSPDGINSDGAAGGDQAGIDGDVNTYWDEEDNKGEYRYVVAFAEAHQIGAISIIGYQQQQYAPRDFDVLVDGKLVKSVKDAAYRNNFLLVDLPATNGKSLELKITRAYGPSPAIRELGIYEAGK